MDKHCRREGGLKQVTWSGLQCVMKGHCKQEQKQQHQECGPGKLLSLTQTCVAPLAYQQEFGTHTWSQGPPSAKGEVSGAREQRWPCQAASTNCQRRNGRESGQKSGRKPASTPRELSPVHSPPSEARTCICARQDTLAGNRTPHTNTQKHALRTSRSREQRATRSA